MKNFIQSKGVTCDTATLMAAAFALDTALTFGGANGDSGYKPHMPKVRENTYYYSVYGFTDKGFCDYMFSLVDADLISDPSFSLVEYSFNEVKAIWLELKVIPGATLESKRNCAESSIRSDLAAAGGLAPLQVDAFMGELNSRRNNFLLGYPSDFNYSAIAVYFEKEQKFLL